MLDPLTAFGLAANVLQFVDFTAKLVSKGNDIHRSATGMLPEHEQISTISSRLQFLSSSLKQKFHTPTTSKHLSFEDHALEAICQGTIEVADDLSQRLSVLTAQGGMSRFKSYRQALKTVWNQDAINSTFKRLELFRGELNTCLLFSIRYVNMHHALIIMILWTLADSKQAEHVIGICGSKVCSRPIAFQ
jgi:hypothetical protein